MVLLPQLSNVLIFAIVVFFSEFYEPNALMMEEEGAVIAGLLVGLNVIDANLCMKGEDLDSQVSVTYCLLYSETMKDYK